MKDLINQLAEIEIKLLKDNNFEKFARNFSRMKQYLSDNGYEYMIPLNEKYSDTRADIEANISGNLSNNMFITQVIKPVIYKKNSIEQKGVVIIESK